MTTPADRSPSAEPRTVTLSDGSVWKYDASAGPKPWFMRLEDGTWYVGYDVPRLNLRGRGECPPLTVADFRAIADVLEPPSLPASRGGEPSEARFTKQMAHEASYIIREELRLRLEARLIPNEADIELYVAYNNGVRDCLATVEHFAFNARPEIYAEVDKERAALRSRGGEGAEGLSHE